MEARSLHDWLGVLTPFHKWMGRIIEDYGFEEGSEFWTKMSETSAKGGRPRKDYQLTLDVAKEVAMVGNTARGKATRRYFIDPSLLASGRVRRFLPKFEAWLEAA